VAVRRVAAAAVLLGLAASRLDSAQTESRIVRFDRAVASAEESLRAGDFQQAESRSREAIVQGWMLAGIVAVSNGRSDEARADFERAASTAVDKREPAAALAALKSKTPESVRILNALTASVPADRRQDEARRVPEAIARLYSNLGVLNAHEGQLGRAAELFEQTVLIDPRFPQAQYSLGVAYFSDQRYEKATGPLTRALEQQPGNADARRMLALAYLNSDHYSEAAALLRDDPGRATNPSLQYAYGLALVRSDRVEQAQDTFSRLLAEHPDVPELNVVLGQAYAAQGDYDAAVTSLRRAIALKPDVADANAALGVIYLKQGQLGASADALRAELALHPKDVKTRYTLATVLDLDGHTDEAMKELASIVAARPAYAEAHYLLGKILLANGSPSDALGHLETAARLSPDDPSTHNQLGLAYQRLGKAELAAREFDTFQRLKDQRRRDSR
jgi:Flp pilus assembly protein TadD